MKDRWRQLAREMELETIGGRPPATVSEWQAEDHMTRATQQAAAQMIWSWSCRGAVSAEQAEMVMAQRRGMREAAEAGKCMGDMKAEELKDQRLGARYRATNRGWGNLDKFLRKSGAGLLAEARTDPTPLHADLIWAWRLDETSSGRGLLVCHFDAALKKMRKLVGQEHPHVGGDGITDMIRST